MFGMAKIEISFANITFYERDFWLHDDLILFHDIRVLAAIQDSNNDDNLRYIKKT